MVGVQDRLDEIRGAARVLVRLLEPTSSPAQWPDQSWQRQQGGLVPRKESEAVHQSAENKLSEKIRAKAMAAAC